MATKTIPVFHGTFKCEHLTDYLKKERKIADIEKIGRENGKDLKPLETDDEIDDVHRELQMAALKFCDEEVATRSEYITHLLSDAQKKLNDVDLQADYDECKRELDNNWEIQLKKQTNLQSLSNTKQLMRRHLDCFKVDNKLRRQARYPDSKLLPIGILVFLVVIESLLNSYFFSKGSELGLLGGFLQAFFISFINVALSFFVGHVALRNAIHVSKSRSSVGWIGFIVYLVAIFCFNLIVAHYRVLLETIPDSAMLQALPDFVAAPFHISNLDALILFALGILSSALALIDGFIGMDDRYPGYGNSARDYLKAKKAFDDAAQKLESVPEMLHKEIVGKLEIKYKDAEEALFASDTKTGDKEPKESSVKELIKSMKEMNRIKEQTSAMINECYKTLIMKYRSSNIEIRRDKPAPPYFYSEVAPVCIIENQSESIELIENRVKEIAEQIVKFKASVDRIGKQLLADVSSMHSGVEGFLSDAESQSKEKQIQTQRKRAELQEERAKKNN